MRLLRGEDQICLKASAECRRNEFVLQYVENLSDQICLEAAAAEFAPLS